MLKIVDVDWLTDQVLQLEFNDGFGGEADLSSFFAHPPFDSVKEFKRFSLTAGGALAWGELQLNAEQLRQCTVGSFSESSVKSDMLQMESVIKQAAWESMEEGRPDILQAAIRAYVEQYGHTQVIQKAGIKSRTSAYRSLQPQTKPNFATLVQLGHAVIELAKQEAV